MVLVEYKALLPRGLTTVIYYIGKVEAMEGNDVTVNCLRRKKRQFSLPAVKDLNIVSLLEVKKVLPEPKLQRGYHSFDIKFPPHLALR